MSITVTSFHGFAGAFAVGAMQAGVELAAVVEPGGWGSNAIERNRGLLGFTGPIDEDMHPAIYDADFLVGNPPCSGFSGCNTSRGLNARGAGSSINHCMVDLVSYASRMNAGRGPLIVAFESVQQAYNQGHGLMLELWRQLRHATGEDYDLTHVLMSGTSVGGAQIRKRYFWVAHRVPFGIEPVVPKKVVTYKDAIGDLERQPLSRDHRPYALPSYEPLPPSDLWTRPVDISDYAWDLRDHAREEVADHVHGDRVWEQRYADLHETWPNGVNSKAAMRLYFEKYGRAPESWDGYDADLWKDSGGFSDTFRVYPHEAGRVITGSGGIAFMHYSEPRVLTIRETSRMMGFPDAWRWDYASFNQVSAHMGKQVPVPSWRWMLEQMRSAAEGQPGSYQGEFFSTEEAVVERVANTTLDYKICYDDKRRLHGVDARSRRWREMMAAR